MKQCKITIVDAPCGYGKTGFSIRYMNEEIFERFIYITPFLSELDRVVKSCTNREFKKPNEKLGEGSKTNHFYKLIQEGNNVVSTHSLFRGLNKEVIDLIKEEEYILILDEVSDVVEQISISPRDIQILINEKIIEIDEDNKVYWIEDSYRGKFNFIKNPIKNGDVYYFNNSLMLWTFPCEIFKVFKEVYILTYMFKGQIQRYYFDLNDVKYEYKSVEQQEEKYCLCDYKEINGVKYKDLIHIYEGKLNDIGDRKTALSKSWYLKANKKEIMKQLKNNTENYYQNILKSKSKINMWTTFEDFKTQTKGKGYARAFVPCNCRATNEYREKTNCAYLINRYYNPMINRFFVEKNVIIDEETWALSELIQWLFRSAIRDGKEINLYIPSKRMRELLQNWLCN